MTRPALSPDLNRAILQLAPAFEARDVAPETLKDLMQAPGIVYAGASDATIYGDPHVNHAFRAWHDKHHALGYGADHPFPFDLPGETLACEAQIKELLQRWPSAPARVLQIIRAEIIGQGLYLQAHGTFPIDQYQFIKSQIGE